MAKCVYKEKYFERNKKLAKEPYACPHEALSDNYDTMYGQKKMCCFHNSKYAQSHPKEVMDKFREFVSCSTYKIRVNVPNTSKEPLKCIGFHIPGEITFENIGFMDPIYFTRAEFYKIVTFKNCDFDDHANFLYAKFHDQAIFKNTNFHKEANFNNASFFDDAHFRGTEGTEERADIYTSFKQDAIFYGATFHKRAIFKGAKFENSDFTKYHVSFTHVDFKDEVDFDSSSFKYSLFPKPDQKNDYEELKNKRPSPIRFDNTIFRKRVRFLGEAERPLYLGLVSLKGVDLTNVIFQNVEWLQLGRIWKRNAIPDEIRLRHMGKSPNYDEVSGIYNQLRKNYESNLYFDEASDFYVGNMETIKLKLSKSSGSTSSATRNKFKSGVYWMYKLINQYGESTFVPLLVWTPVIIFVFALIRHYNCISPLPMSLMDCTVTQDFVDSLFAYFQFPVEKGYDDFLDTLERVISLPILALAVKSFALTKRFETAIR